MRTPIIAGNWKMNKNVAEAVELVRALREAAAAVEKVEMVVCPPFVSLAAVKDALAGSKIGLGAQNVYWEEKGAFTGEISPLMLKDLVTYVIIGHSERRQYFGETDATVNKRVKAALAHGLTPILCVGETLAQREAGETSAVVSNQVINGLAGFSAEEVKSIVIAYEPVWAIGTGRASTGEDANAVVAQNIRTPLSKLFGEAVAQGVRVQYGGSVTAANAAEFMGMPEIDGALVGGASLKVADFTGIITATAQAK
ncbi:triosephosphate isomerase (TIM) [Thermoflexales bacterium]|nr:triosephosphate isomerase (TIM) [Thermoflexales bacterium]